MKFISSLLLVSILFVQSFPVFSNEEDNPPEEHSENFANLIQAFSSQSIGRFLFVNGDTEYDKLKLKEQVLSVALELAKEQKFMGGLDSPGFRRFAGYFPLIDLFSKAFSQLADNGHVTESELNNYLKDTEILKDYFKAFSGKLAVYILAQYVPLSLDQQKEILTADGLTSAPLGLLIDNVMSFNSRSPDRMLGLFNKDELAGILNSHQMALIEELAGAPDKKNPAFNDLRLDLGDLLFEVSRKPPEQIARESTLFSTFMSRYFQCQSDLWTDKYDLSPQEVKKLEIASRLALSKSAAFYTDNENLKKLPPMERMMLSEVPATHILSSGQTRIKMVERISSRVTSENSDSPSPISDFNHYFNLVAEMNLDFILVVMNIFGPEMGAQAQSPGLTGHQTVTIRTTLLPDIIKSKRPVNFPHFSILSRTMADKDQVFRGLLRPEQMPIFNEMARQFTRDVEEDFQEPVPVDAIEQAGQGEEVLIRRVPVEVPPQ